MIWNAAKPGVLLPDADISDPDNESDSDTEQSISGELSSEEADSVREGMPLAAAIGYWGTCPSLQYFQLFIFLINLEPQKLLTFDSMCLHE